MQLASVIRGIVSQRLVSRADGNGRVPAVEVMIGTLSVREAIINEDKTREISNLISSGMSHYGTQTFDQSLLVLYKKGMISYDEALMSTSNPDDFILKVKGIQSTSDLTWEDDERRKQARRPASPAPGTAPKPEGGGQEYKPKEKSGGDFEIERFGDK